MGGGVTWLLVTVGQLVIQLLTLAVASPSPPPTQMTAPTFSVAFHSARLELSLFQRDFQAV